MTINIETVLCTAPVIPVVVIDDADHAPDLARALYDGGIGIIEITRRTPAAPAALAAIRRALPEMIAGMGTVWSQAQVSEAADHGAQFIVSPGVADEVDTACDKADLAYLPGAQTVSELAHISSRGRRAAKLFPAATLGGPAAVKAYASVLPDMMFCPTGGITAEAAPDYLAIEPVRCVGGSWLAPKPAIARRDWAALRAAAEHAATLGG